MDGPVAAERQALHQRRARLGRPHRQRHHLAADGRVGAQRDISQPQRLGQRAAVEGVQRQRDAGPQDGLALEIERYLRGLRNLFDADGDLHRGWGLDPVASLRDGVRGWGKFTGHLFTGAL